MKREVLDKAMSAKVMVCITFHYDTGRLGYLSRVLKSLSQFMVERMHIVIITNTTNFEEVKMISQLSHAYNGGPVACEVRIFPHLPHPFMLTWSHKQVLAETFSAPDNPYDYFVYLEDDIQFSFQNFCYFLDYREALRPTGLLPSFLRVEYSRDLVSMVSSDCCGEPYRVPLAKTVRVGDLVFANAGNPYNAMYVLDRELAAEYMASVSFDVAASVNITDWCLRERAAMGLTFERIPPDFTWRYVVPISLESRLNPSFCWIYHLPNNYAENPHVTTGTIRMDSLFQLEDETAG